MENKEKGKIGLMTATFMLIGTIIGASSFVASGYQAEAMGPAVWLVYIIGALLTVPVCIQSAQIGCILPVEGSSYVMVKKTSGKLSTFMYGWLYIIWTAIWLPYCAHTIAKYVRLYIPGANVYVVAVIALLLFGVIHSFGFEAAARFQSLIVIILMAAMLVFVIMGIPHVKLSNLTPMFPKGAGPVVGQIIPAYFGFVGINTMTEWAGNVHKPQKNLPKAMFLCMVIVTLLYCGMTAVLCGMIPYTKLGIDTPVSIASMQFGMPAVTALVTLGAMFATISTLNGMYVCLTHELHNMSCQGSMPALFKKTAGKKNAPIVAVWFSVAAAILLSFMSESIMEYIDVATAFVMVSLIHSAFVSVRLKKVLPKAYDEAAFKMKGIWYYIWPILEIASCGFILVVTLAGSPKLLFPMIVIIGIGIVFYYVYAAKHEAAETEGEMQKSI